MFVYAAVRIIVSQIQLFKRSHHNLRQYRETTADRQFRWSSGLKTLQLGVKCHLSVDVPLSASKQTLLSRVGRQVLAHDQLRTSCSKSQHVLSLTAMQRSVARQQLWAALLSLLVCTGCSQTMHGPKLNHQAAKNAVKSVSDVYSCFAASPAPGQG